MTTEEMVWDLSQLVENVDPIRIQQQLQLMVEEAPMDQLPLDQAFAASNLVIFSLQESTSEHSSLQNQIIQEQWQFGLLQLE